MLLGLDKYIYLKKISEHENILLFPHHGRATTIPICWLIHKKTLGPQMRNVFYDLGADADAFWFYWSPSLFVILWHCFKMNAVAFFGAWMKYFLSSILNNKFSAWIQNEKRKFSSFTHKISESNARRQHLKSNKSQSMRSSLFSLLDSLRKLVFDSHVR